MWPAVYFFLLLSTLFQMIPVPSSVFRIANTFLPALEPLPVKPNVPANPVVPSLLSNLECEIS